MDLKKNILAVVACYTDDNNLTEILSDEYNVLYAYDAEDALKILKSSEIMISAAVIDCKKCNPGSFDENNDIIKILTALKSEFLHEGIPALVLLEDHDIKMESEILSAGADDFIIKPFCNEVLLNRLRNLICLREAMCTVNLLECDSLTGLLNKEAFYRRAEEIFREREQSDRYFIVALDVENFKLFNDNYGMKRGDELLVYIADAIRSIYGVDGNQNEICARFFADQFMLIIKRNHEEIRKMPLEMKKILRCFDVNMKVYVKYGIYAVDDYDVPVNIMCDRAVLAANIAKGNYNMDYVIYDDSIRARLSREKQITDRMEIALEEGEFEVFFQPKYDLFTEKLAGAEALVRWNNPRYGYMKPGEFIPVFEKNGFITRLDLFVWNKTCDYVAEWMAGGLASVPVSVNVSRKDIYKENLCTAIQDIVKRHGLKPQQIHLEITESAYTEEPEQLVKVVTELKKAGFTIEMDDFGSGYSSLNMLAKLPIDVLKIDMKLIQNASDETSSRNIMSFVIGLAKYMNLYVIAEGIEDYSQVTTLRNMDSNYAQGYYFSRPLPADEFRKLLAESEISPMPGANESVFGSCVVFRNNDKEQIMLVVDDLSMNRAILHEYFHNTFNIIEISSGVALLSYLRHGGRADIILLDLYMPEMDGFEVLREIKKSGFDVPIIITSQAGEAKRSAAMALGAAEYLAKPYSKETALDCVNSVLVKIRQEDVQREMEILGKMHEMEKLATTDYLTGLYNRAELEHRTEQFLRETERRCSFIMMDIDNFKNINDTLGHLAGDEVLVKVADILKNCFRDDDVISRMGGDEFAILMKASFDLESLRERMSRVHHCLDFRFRGMKVSCSSGVCMCPEHGHDFLTLYNKADSSLLEAKRSGKNRFIIYGE